MSPSVIAPGDPGAFTATYRTLLEALIGLALGRVVNGGPVTHEHMVKDTLLAMARRSDQEQLS